MPKSRLQRGLAATFLGLVTNVILATIKLVTGIVGHSHALVADAVESFADMFSSLIVWRALVVAAQPADADHPYGHGKAEPLASAIVATMLLLAAAGIAFKSLQEIFVPQRGPEPFTLLVLIVVVLVKEGLFRFVSREAGAMESSAVLTDAWHHRSDALTSLCAALGISIALIGGDGYLAADGIAAIAAAGIIAFNGLRLLRPALRELMDASPSDSLTGKIAASAEAIPEVRRVEKCVARKMGYQYFVDMHVEVNPDMTVLEAHEVAHRVKDKVRTEFPTVLDVLVHIEPARPAHRK